MDRSSNVLVTNSTPSTVLQVARLLFSKSFPSTKYCSSRKKSSYHCSPGLLFNTATVQCDWPDNVDCSSSASSTTASPGSSQPSSTTSPPQSSTTSKATTTTRKPTTTTTEGTNTKNPPAQGEEVLTCAGRDTSEPISEEVMKLRETTCSLDNSQVT